MRNPHDVKANLCVERVWYCGFFEWGRNDVFVVSAMFKKGNYFILKRLSRLSETRAWVN